MQDAILIVGRLYILPGGDVVKAVRVSEQRNVVIVHNYGSQQNEVIEYNMAPKLLTPVLRIGEVAKLFGKKPDTLRRYEREGLIDEPIRYRMNDSTKEPTRLYGPSDIRKLVRFFERRNPVGRPSPTNRPGINKELIENKLKVRYKNG